MMKERTIAALHIIIWPFVISASFEFLPAWLYWPIAFVGFMYFAGSCLMLAKKENRD